MGRIQRALSLAQQSFRLLMRDKELLVLPVLSGICMGLLFAGFAFGMNSMGVSEETLQSQQGRMQVGLATFAFYVSSYTIGYFFQAALVAGALERIRGGDPTLGSALGAAGTRIGPILAWGLVSGTVGMALKAIQSRSEFSGQMLAGLFGTIWTVATFFVVPVLVMESRSITGSFTESARIVRKTWGESLAGNIGFGTLTFLLCLPFVGLGFLLAQTNLLLGGSVGALGVCAVCVFTSALNGIFVASVYWYAKQEEVPEGFDEIDLAGAFSA